MRNVKYSPQYWERRFFSWNDYQTHMSVRDWWKKLENFESKLLFNQKRKRGKQKQQHPEISLKTSDLMLKHQKWQLWCAGVWLLAMLLRHILISSLRVSPETSHCVVLPTAICFRERWTFDLRLQLFGLGCVLTTAMLSFLVNSSHRRFASIHQASYPYKAFAALLNQWG